MSAIETYVQQFLNAGFPLDSKYGPYADLTARDAIPASRRYEGMQVYVLNDQVYKLVGGILNADWVGDASINAPGLNDEIIFSNGAGGLQTRPGVVYDPSNVGVRVDDLFVDSMVEATKPKVIYFDITTKKLTYGDPVTLGGLPTGDLDQNPSNTSGDEDQSGVIIASTPTAGVSVYTNGLKVNLGSGVKTKDCYFSPDGGVTARAFGAIISGDELIWNGVISGYNLAATDSIDFIY